MQGTQSNARAARSVDDLKTRAFLYNKLKTLPALYVPWQWSSHFQFSSRALRLEAKLQFRASWRNPIRHPSVCSRRPLAEYKMVPTHPPIRVRPIQWLLVFNIYSSLHCALRNFVSFLSLQMLRNDIRRVYASHPSCPETTLYPCLNS